MNNREKLARKLCIHNGIDPDVTCYGTGHSTSPCAEDKNAVYKAWEYQAKHYVDVIGEDNGN